MIKGRIPSSPFGDVRTMPAGKGMIVQVALRNGPESKKVAGLQRILKASGHRDRFERLPRQSSHVSLCEAMSAPRPTRTEGSAPIFAGSLGNSGPAAVAERPISRSACIAGSLSHTLLSASTSLLTLGPRQVGGEAAKSPPQSSHNQRTSQFVQEWSHRQHPLFRPI